MRTGSIPVISIQRGQRQGDVQQSSASRLGIDLEGSAEMAHAFLHSDQAHAADAQGIETAAVVMPKQSPLGPGPVSDRAVSNANLDDLLATTPLTNRGSICPLGDHN